MKGENDMHNPKQYSTRDLALAAFLIEQGHKLLRLEPTGNFKTFIFPSEAEEDVPGFFAGRSFLAVCCHASRVCCAYQVSRFS